MTFKLRIPGRDDLDVLPAAKAANQRISESRVHPLCKFAALQPTTNQLQPRQSSRFADSQDSQRTRSATLRPPGMKSGRRA